MNWKQSLDIAKHLKIVKVRLLNFKVTIPTIAISLILITSFFLGTYGNNWGLPMHFQPDEPIIINRAIRIAQTGDLNPHRFWYPSLFIYINAIVIKFELFLDWQGLIHTNNAMFYLSGRSLSALFGSLTLLLVYYIGKTLYNVQTGLTAAIFLAVMPRYIEFSHYAKVEIALVFFSTLCIFFLALLLKNDKFEYYLLAGIASGLAISIKYTAGTLLIPIFVVHLLNSKKQMHDYSWRTALNIFWNKNLILPVALSGIFFVIGTPYSLIDFKTFWHDVVFQTESTQDLRIYLLGTAPGWIYHLENSLKNGMGTNLEILSILGVGYTLLLIILNKKRIGESIDIRAGILLLSWILPYYMIIGSWQLKMNYYTLPLFPFLALLGANVLVSVVNYITEKIVHSDGRISIYKNIFLAIVVVIFIIAPTQSSISIIETFAKEDTRQIALNWVEENLPRNVTIIRDPIYTPEVEYIKNMKSSIINTNSYNYSNEITKKHADFIIVSSYMYSRYYDHPNEGAKEIKFYNSLNEHFNLIKIFYPSTDNPGPTLKIYKIFQNSTNTTQSESIKVPADRPDPIYTNMTLKAGNVYLIRASGVCSFWKNSTEGVDAYYGYAKGRFGNNPVPLAGLYLDNMSMYNVAKKNRDPIDYNSLHAYQTYLIGTGKKLKLHLLDKDKVYKDNHGFISVVVIPESFYEDNLRYNKSYSPGSMDNIPFLVDAADYRYWISQGNALSQLGNYNDSLKAYDKAIYLDPTNKNAWIAKGRVLSQLGNYNDSLVAYDNAIDLDPNNKDIWIAKAQVFNKMGNFNESINAYNKAIDINPKNPSTWITKGSALENKRKYNDSLNAYEEAIKLDPNNKNAWIAKGRVLSQLGNYNDSLIAYDKAIDLDPNNKNAWIAKGRVLSQLGNYNDSLVAYDNAIDLDPNNKDIWIARTKILDKMGNFNESKKA